jgi:rhamnosyltransferase
MTREDPAISVLTRTFNSEKTVPRLLDRLDLAPGDEVVVVDSGSTDHTLDIAERHGARAFRAPPPFNYSKSLNIGFRNARNSWVLVISSHSIPQVPDLLAIFRAAAAAFPADVVAGYGMNLVDARIRSADEKIKYFTVENVPSESGGVGNTVALYRRSAWEAGAFDESIRTAEDHLWMVSRAKQGARFAFVPAARTLNCNSYSLRYMFMKGYSDARAGTGAKMTLRQLALNWGSTTKRLLFDRMSPGNWIRLLAHGMGACAGSHAERGNKPW